ncbi:MAG: ATP-binding protein [Bacteroidota bacterium]
MFKPSVNIIRDTPEALNFLVTPNAARVYQIIKDNFLFGNRAFSLIGTYGTGKSSFLLALEKHLSDTSGIFESSFSADDQFDFIKILGGYDSLISTVAKEINATDVTEKSILDRLSETKGEKNRVFILDEFGKFLEYAGEHAPERELYFIQLLAEYASEPSNQLIFITTLHQGFDAYATGLNQRQRNEWEKVKGRFTEIPFNEPVEQLIHIASDRIPSLIPKKSFSNLSLSLSLAEKKNILKFRLNDRDRLAIPRKLLPLDIISVFVLAKAIQEFGQNERSLFSFLESANHLGLKEFLEEGKGEMYDLVQVYDYLAFNFYSAINSRFNPHLIRWNHIEESIDQMPCAP